MPPLLVRPFVAVAFAILALSASALHAQTPPPKCPLTGITLIPGAKSEKGFFSLLAIKASIDMNAKEAGQTLTDDFEVYKLPASPGQSLVEAMQASIRAQGWNVALEATKPGVSEQWGWMWRPETPSQRFLIYYLLDKKQSYLAFARRAGSEIVSAAAPTPTTVVTAPPAGTPTTSSVALFEPPPPPPATPPRPNAPANTRSGWGYFNTSFSDGWQAFDEPDWVRGVKGPITARVHHANFDLTRYVNQDGTIFVWNQLIVPRYRDLTNVWVRKPWWEDGDKNYVSAEGTEIATGRRHFLVLFRNGNGRHWIEYLAPDKATFEREMGITVQVQGGTNWSALARDGLNKFAVSENDLPGYWGSSSSAGVEYVSALTGNSLGIGAVSSDYKFTFRPDGTYEMRYVGASGMAGNQKFGGENWAGRVIMNGPWKMSLTGTFKGQTYEYDVWFEALKGGGRILVLRRHDYDIRLMRSGR